MAKLRWGFLTFLGLPGIPIYGVESSRSSVATRGEMGKGGRGGSLMQHRVSWLYRIRGAHITHVF